MSFVKTDVMAGLLYWTALDCTGVQSVCFEVYNKHTIYTLYTEVV